MEYLPRAGFPVTRVHLTVLRYLYWITFYSLLFYTLIIISLLLRGDLDPR